MKEMPRRYKLRPPLAGLPRRYHPRIMTWTPWHFVVVAVSGSMNRGQQEVIDHLNLSGLILR